MKKWAKYLAVPMTLALLTACDAGEAEEMDETEEVTEANEESEGENEEVDATTSATEDGEGGWLGTDAESSLTPEEAYELEDLHATGNTQKETTIEGLEMTDEDWVEQAAELTEAVEGDAYVNLDRGILTVDQIDNFLKAMPFELTYADDNNQFLYYNHILEPEDMLGARNPIQAGHPLHDVHPEGTHKNVAWIINQLRTKETDHVRMAVPSGGADQFVVHDYYGIYDDEGNYMGINEIIHDIMPQVEFYLEQTGAEITYPEGYDADAVSGATE